jgi:hypothetical protein
MLNGSGMEVGQDGPHYTRKVDPRVYELNEARKGLNDHLGVTFGQNNPGRLNCPQARAAEPRPRRQDVHCDSFQALQRGNDGNEKRRREVV